MSTFQIASPAPPAPASGSPNPGLHGFKAWAWDPIFADTSATQPTAGTINLTKIPVLKTISVTQVSVLLQGTGTSVTGYYVGIYDSTGAQLCGGVSSSQHADVNANSGVRTYTVGNTAATIIGSDTAFVYVAILSAGGTSPGTARRTPLNSTFANAGLSASAYRFAINGTGQTTLPSSFTLASNSLSGLGYWAAIS